MADPIAVILRFKGDSDDLVERFEQALKARIEAQGERGNPPIFFAVCATGDGVALITGWEAEEDHKGFRKQMMPHLHAAGIARPEAHEQLPIVRLGRAPTPPL